MSGIATLQIPTELYRDFAEYARETGFTVKATARMILSDAIKRDRITDIIVANTVERKLIRDKSKPKSKPKVSLIPSLEKKKLKNRSSGDITPTVMSSSSYTGMAYDYHAMGDDEEKNNDSSIKVVDDMDISDIIDLV